MQRTGDTIAPSALSCFIALSTSLRSRPLSSAILPAFRGWPASFIVANTFSFVSIIVRFFVVDIFILLLSGKTIGVRNYRFIGHPLILVHSLLGLSRVVTGEDKVNRWSSERRDQACSGYPEISCKREQSQACLAMPSAADIQRS